MTNAQQCDNCHGFATLDGNSRWWKLEPAETEALILEPWERRQHHFCSWHCLGEYARRKETEQANHLAA